MNSRPAGSTTSAVLQPINQLFRSLGEPARLEILNHLLLGEHRVVELTEHLGLAQSTTSAHLAVLREAGLVSVRSDGRSSVYSVNGATELAALLAAAECLADAAGISATADLSTAPERHSRRSATPEHRRRIGGSG